MIRKQLRILSVLLCMLSVCGLAALAQSVRGSLAGSVTDPTGAQVPGVKVTAKNEATGATSETVTSSAGSYRFPELPLGRYTVTVTAPGFKTSTSTGVLITLNNTTPLDIQLTTGSAEETVTVSAEAPTVQTESSDISGTVDTRQVVELPLALGGVGAMRSPEAFVFLLPGTTGPGSGSSSNGVFFARLSGGQSYGAEVLLDGASQTRSENGSAFDEEAPSVEALQEFKVTTSTPTAEFGRTTGGVESFVTKSGTNQYHGTAFEIFRNDALDANTWFNNGYLAQNCVGANDTPACRSQYRTPSDKKNDYGGTLGGPVQIPKLYNGKDKTFFFFAWEQFRQTLGATNISTVPTLSQRNGDFSDILGGPTGTINPCTGQPVLQNQIFDPLTSRTVNGINCRDPFPNNTIPGPRFSAVAQNITKFVPPPNQTGITGTQGVTQNFAITSTRPINNTTMTIRIDQSISDKNKIYGSYSSRENNLITSGNLVLPEPIDPLESRQDFTTHFGRFGWDYVLSPTLLNHFNFGFNRSNSKNFTPAQLTGVNYAAQIGLGNVNATGWPTMTFDTLDQYGSSPQGPQFGRNNQNSDNVDNGWRFNDSVNWQKGRHSFKFGVDHRIQQFSPLAFNNPTFNFRRSETDYGNVGAAQQISGNSWASLLLGQVDSAAQNPRSYQQRWTQRYIAGFFQDDLKVSSTLTLNLGARYDIDFPRHEAHNNTSNFSLSAPDPTAAGRPGALIFGRSCHCNAAWADTYFKDIGPRLGFAWAPAKYNGRFVVRGGYGILYAPLQYSDFGGAMVTGYQANPNPVSPDGFSPAFALDSGFPPFPAGPNFDPGQLTGPPGSGVFQPVGNEYIAPTYGRPAMVNNWSLQIQQEVATDLIATIGYIGQSAQNLRSSLENINNIPLSAFSYGDRLNDPIPLNGSADGVNAPYAGFTGPVQRALRPYPQYDFIATDCCLQNIGHSSYEALVASLERRFRNGLNLQASYTWAKNLTDADSSLPNTNAGVQQDQNVFDHRAEKAVSIQNIPHTFVISYLYELPLGKGQHFANSGSFLSTYVIGGWQVGGVQRYQSGQPISFGCASGIPGYQNCIRFSATGNDFASPTYRQSGIKGINPFAGQRMFAGILDPSNPATFPTAAFVDYNTDPFRHGGPFTLGQGIPRVTEAIRSPMYLSEDFAIIKNIPIHERLSFQFKAELLDAFNRHNFTIPDVNPYDTNFGIPTSTYYGPRNVQFTGRINF